MLATVVLLGLGMTGCGSKTSPTALVTTGSAKPSARPSPVGSHCPDAPGTETIFVDGITTVGGDFAVTGYQQSTTCGPGVPDDYILNNVGPHRSFVLPADVQVELLGSVPSDQHAATLADLEELLNSAFATPKPTGGTANGSMLWSHNFLLALGAGGKITKITSLYHP